MHMKTVVLSLLFTLLPFVFVACNSTSSSSKPEESASTGKTIRTQTTWKSFINPLELNRLMDTEDVVVIDARSPAAYEEGHIPGAINLPGSSLRTGKAKPGAGDSQYIFRTLNGQADIPRYEGYPQPGRV